MMFVSLIFPTDQLIIPGIREIVRIFGWDLNVDLHPEVP